MVSKNYFILALIATLLALTVIQLGAYTRLKDAGLGCPDWPGCYGQIAVPESVKQIAQVEKEFPKAEVQPQKAWLEMIHRYFAGTLATLILILALWGFIRRYKIKSQPLVAPILLILVIIFQAALGMWTVTLQLLPIVVMGHLLGGMTIVSLLWWLTMASGDKFQMPASKKRRNVRPFAIIGLIIVVLQIFLGGWTSSNYAALACSHFPFCEGSLFPHMNFHQAFNFFSPLGVDYQGGVLNTTARVTIQMMHRYGAFITATYIGILAIVLIASKAQTKLRGMGWVMLIILALQFCLGILNVETHLALPIAMAHNGVAALLLLSVVTLNFKVFRKPTGVSHE